NYSRLASFNAQLDKHCHGGYPMCTNSLERRLAHVCNNLNLSMREICTLEKRRGLLELLIVNDELRADRGKRLLETRADPAFHQLRFDVYHQYILGLARLFIDSGTNVASLRNLLGTVSVGDLQNYARKEYVSIPDRLPGPVWSENPEGA